MNPDACILCGLCNAGDDAYSVSLDERRAPRNLVRLLKEHKDSPFVYAAMLNGRSTAACPLGIEIDDTILAARQRLVKAGVETAQNKAFMAKLMKGENPFK